MAQARLPVELAHTLAIQLNWRAMVRHLCLVASIIFQYTQQGLIVSRTNRMICINNSWQAR